MGPHSELPPRLRQYLRDDEIRARRLAVIGAVGFALTILLLWALIACAADRLLHLPSIPRIALLGIALISAALVMAHAIAAQRRRMDWIGTATRIERQDPQFGQSLLTVISRLLGPTAHRGSEEILSHLLHDLEYKVATQRRRRLFPPAGVILPWLVCVILLSTAVSLWKMPGFGLGQLIRRFVEPLADLPPVTTTQIHVFRGNQDIVQSATLHIEAETQNLGAQPLWLYRNVDGNWVRSVMAGAGVGRFSFTLSGVDRDVRYYLQGGDAQTPAYFVRVLRPPAVDQFKIHYVFPSHTGRVPMTVTNSDGLVEAPMGTTATIMVFSSEPLQSALLSVGGEKILMERTADDAVRRAELVLRKDAHCELDMISTREVAGSGPPTMQIRAIPDRAPVVRLLQAGQSIRLNPRDIIPLSYEAVDDFGVVSLSVRYQANALPISDTPIPLNSDHRRQESVFDFDLAARKLGIGDVVTLSLVATDTSGQVSVSDPLHVLISPRSVDAQTHNRIAELRSALQFAGSLIDELQAADKSLADAEAARGKQPAAFSQASAQSNRHLTSASEDATLMRQALYRATLNSNVSALSQALSGWIDAAQTLADSADDLFRHAGSALTPGNVPRARLQQALERSRQIQAQMLVVAQGQQAETVLADRENLLASEHKAPPAGSGGAERFQQTLQRAKEDIAAGARNLGIDPNGADLENRLRAKVDASASLLNSANPVDYAAAAHDWSEEIQKSPQQRQSLEDRLSAAAEAEAIRPDADLSRARDLQLASRAAGSIESMIAQSAGRPVPAGLTNEFAAAVAALQREHRLHRQIEKRSPEELAVIHGAAGKAREQMARWAPDVEDPSTSPQQSIASARAPGGKEGAASKNGSARGGAAAASVEELALQASAAAAARDYARSAALDQQLMKKLTEVQSPGASTRPIMLSGSAAPGAVAQARAAERRADEQIERKIERQKTQVNQSMERARKIDGLGSVQDALTRQTLGGTENLSPQVLGQQRKVADDIAQVGIPAASQGAAPAPAGVIAGSDDANWRDRATETLLSVQAELASMPQALAELQQSGQAARDAEMRAAAARQTAGSAPPDQRLSSQRAARQASQDAQDAAARVERDLKPVSRDSVDAIAARLAPFAPETSGAHDVVSQQLGAAVGNLAAAAKGGDMPAAARAAADSRAAIETAQRELAQAQDAFTERDPLSAAKWFARAAADSLSRQPPDLRSAQTHQARVSVALGRAWDRSIHEAAARRLSAVPSLAGVYAPETPGGAPGTANGASAPGFAAAREWGRLLPRGDDSVNVTLHESDPAGYEESLKLYFEALGNAQEGKGN